MAKGHAVQELSTCMYDYCRCVYHVADMISSMCKTLLQLDLHICLLHRSLIRTANLPQKAMYGIGQPASKDKM